jgi:periplasmic protein TonB
MAYVVETGSRRFVGSGGVIAVHVTLAYLLVFGLQVPDFDPPVVPPLVGEQIPLPPAEPPPPEKTEEQKIETPIETPVHNPDPPIELKGREEFKYEPPIFRPLPPPPIPRQPVEPVESGLVTPTLARPLNQVARWVTPDHYPPGSIRREEQGVTGFSLRIDSRGNVTDCIVTVSSGYEALDQATCKNVLKRAKLAPATNKYGEKVPGTYSNSVNWVLPE